MANIYAFRAVRPQKELTERFAALPYDVYSREEAKIEVEREPESFLRIDRAETQFERGIDIYSDQVYQKAHDLLWDLIKKGKLCQDTENAYYVYELTMNGRIQTGLVACADVDDYLNGVIKKHENTRAEKEQDRIRHVDCCNAQTGPIFLAYRHHPVISETLQKAKSQEPLFDFTSSDGICHRGWMISDQSEIQKIAGAFREISDIYIADGHHRAASAVKVALKRREEIQSGKRTAMGQEENRFLSVLFSENELYIMDYNRVVSDLNGYKKSEFLEKLKEIYEIDSAIPDIADVAKEKGCTGMYLDGRWYSLRIREKYLSKDPVDGLDVALLQKYVFSPLLGINDPKTDNRISFVGGIRGRKVLETMADECGGVAFAMHPTTMEELFAVADAGKLMPPKSTWFEPKLRSGLFIHLIGDH